ncbi:M20 family peptidase [Flavilitoribacter nigricans]|uniref:Peptidase M20 dimerisation domain-containing protein n=1 Tax=Flavilitoribacter nigricans (strain ATCC 23147 / DSM 23189 / NBRC 102662 / NCIMB 1420 / SS-2) TaxID=1122177 RepID=A0A2D0NHX0_FLAN2|nr:M20 family peptidase [Flavilitoribacter nigricans]PHN08102.1 hypothetical protein CRP01_01920 [Flavilitoribacter nigricans DSM 23189 = NBRC 102662]
MKRIFIGITVLITLFLMLLLFRSMTSPSRQKDYPAVSIPEISPEAKRHLAEAISIPTISFGEESRFDSTAFQRYADFISRNYPLVDSLLEKKTFNDFSYLYHWKGSGDERDPILLMSHYDVVPVEPATIHNWRQPPYSGAIVADTIWGRGAIDDKTAGIAILETFEQLLQEGYRPRRDIYVALSHDEEKGGSRGASSMAAYLQERGVRFDYILDEGGAITEGIIPGVEKEVALVGIAEKGYLNLELSTSLSGGHSSIPLGTNSIDVLTAGLARLRANPFPARISEPLKLFFDYLGPESTLAMKFAFTNADVLEPLILQGLSQIPQGKANIRTTMVPTIFSSGIKENVIPKVASANINLRIIPGETVESAIAYVRKTLDDDRIRIQAQDGASDPSKVSDVESEAYEMVCRSVREIFREVVVAPHLLVGGTDSRYFAELTDHIFRFRPLRVNPDNIQSFHGLNERVTVADLENSIRFYYQLVRNSAS